VVEVARWLACKTSLLESGQAEAAEARLANLLSRLDQLQERTAHLNKDTQNDNKVTSNLSATLPFTISCNNISTLKQGSHENHVMKVMSHFVL
jgi:hypothetical protein